MSDNVEPDHAVVLLPCGSKVYRVRVWIGPDYSVYAADLPGCASHGDSVKECLDMIREAFIAVVESYIADGVAIPFVQGGNRPLFHEERFLAIKVGQ